jgi:L-lactate dehydrogenase complex protein LldG
MSNRNIILDKIKKNKPEFIALSEFNGFDNQQKSIDLLIETLKTIKTETTVGNNITPIQDKINLLKKEGNVVLNLLDELNADEKEALILKTAADLASLDYAFIRGQIAVAENGAIWLSDKNTINRLVPFICKHLILVIEEKNIVADMHEAYASININEDGYGVFISGPSKTADIEQSLVIGAHGPLSLNVFILQF